MIPIPRFFAGAVMPKRHNVTNGPMHCTTGKPMGMGGYSETVAVQAKESMGG